MVNERELKVIKKYEKQGWKTIRCGAPDFLFVKVKGGKIDDFFFDEVKSPNNDLSYEQEIWRKVLSELGAKYKVDIVR